MYLNRKFADFGCEGLQHVSAFSEQM